MRTNRILALVLLALIASPAQALNEGVESLRETGKAFAAVARQVSPSVVFVQVESTRGGGILRSLPFPFGEAWPFPDEFFERFFGERFRGSPGGEPPKDMPRRVAQGSGFVFAAKPGWSSERTYIVTNNHVVAEAEKITVKFQDGREFDARVKGRDPKSDVAVIEIDAKGVPALAWGDSSRLEVGEWVVAIGNPFGLSHSLTVGVVSAKGRTSLGISDYEDFIQTDAAINPGNSGGPLVNLSGEVVGVNTAIFSRSGGYMGLGFAIPSNLARGIAEQLVETGEVVRGVLGVVIQPLTPDLAESFGLKQSQGALVAKVAEGSPADKAGLKAGDVIVSYQGTPVRDVGEFRNRVALTAPGTRETITIVRDGQRREVEVTLGRLGKAGTLAEGPTQSAEELGLTVQTLTPELAKQFDATPGEGVVVTRVEAGSAAAAAGIRTGDIILEVNRKSVDSAEAFDRRVVASRSTKRVLLLVRSGEAQRYVVLNF